MEEYDSTILDKIQKMEENIFHYNNHSEDMKKRFQDFRAGIITEDDLSRDEKLELQEMYEEEILKLIT